MVQINFALKEVNCKIVFYGPGMSGKTTNLEIVHQKAPEENKGELTSISTDGDRTLFFDFMPLDLGTVAGMRTKFQLYTVPGQVYYNSTRKLVLQGVDGVIFIADSGADKVSENIESYDNLIENLEEYGKDIRELPHVIQYNKRDLPNALPVEELDQQINKFGVPTFEAVANTGEGVFPTLKVLAGMVLESIDKMDSRRPAAKPPTIKRGPTGPVAQGTRKRKPTTAAAADPAGARRKPGAARPPSGRVVAAQSPSGRGPADRPGPGRGPGGRPPAGRAAAQPSGRKLPARAGGPRPATARPAPARAVADARRKQGLASLKRKRGIGIAVGLTLLMAAAVAGVVFFFMQNPGY